MPCLVTNLEKSMYVIYSQYLPKIVYFYLIVHKKLNLKYFTFFILVDNKNK